MKPNELFEEIAVELEALEGYILSFYSVHLLVSTLPKRFLLVPDFPTSEVLYRAGSPNKSRSASVNSRTTQHWRA